MSRESQCRPAAQVLLSLLPNGPTPSQVAAAAPGPTPAVGSLAPLTTVQGGLVTCARSTPGMCLNSLGQPTLIGPNQPRVEPTGLLVEGPTTNYVTYSQNPFGWSTNGAILTANQATAPDGTNTAMLQTAAAGNSVHLNFQAVTPPNSINTLSVYAKAGTVRFLGLIVQNFWTAAFDLVAGTSSNPTNGSTATIVAAGGGWFRCSVTTTSGASTFVSIALGDTLAHADANGTGGAVWTAAGTETIFVWGVQLENLPFPSSYFPTNTNGVLQSAGLLSPAWSVDATVTNTAAAAVAPDGTTTAALLTTVAGGLSNMRCYAGFFTFVGSTYSYSFYAKRPSPASNSVAYVTVGDASLSFNYCVFDIANQRRVPSLGLNVVSTLVTPMANGWARYQATMTGGATGGTFFSFWLAETTTGQATGAYSPAGGYSVYVWGAQGEDGSVASQFMATGAALTTTRAADALTTPAPAASQSPTSGGSITYTQSCRVSSVAAWDNAQYAALAPVLMDWANASADRTVIYTGGVTPGTTNFQGLVSNDSGTATNVGALIDPTGVGAGPAGLHKLSVIYRGPGQTVGFRTDDAPTGNQVVMNGPKSACGTFITFGGIFVPGFVRFFGWLRDILITSP